MKRPLGQVQSASPRGNFRIENGKCNKKMPSNCTNEKAELFSGKTPGICRKNEKSATFSGSAFLVDDNGLEPLTLRTSNYNVK